MAKKKGEVSTFEPKNTKSGKKRPTASGLIDVTEMSREQEKLKKREKRRKKREAEEKEIMEG